jgi:hypothetical protein
VVLTVQREIGMEAFAGVPMSIIKLCLIVFGDDSARCTDTDRTVLRSRPP